MLLFNIFGKLTSLNSVFVASCIEYAVGVGDSSPSAYNDGAVRKVSHDLRDLLPRDLRSAELRSRAATDTGRGDLFTVLDRVCRLGSVAGMCVGVGVSGAVPETSLVVGCWIDLSTSTIGQCSLAKD